MIARHVGGILRSLLGRKRSPFSRAAKAERTRTLPGQNISCLIGDSHNRVVERSLDVRNAVRNVLPLFFLERFLLAFFFRRCCSGSRCRLLLLVLP